MARFLNWLFGVDNKESSTRTASEKQSTVDHHQNRTNNNQTASNASQPSVNDEQTTADILSERERGLAAERQRLSLQHWQDAQKKSTSDSQKQSSRLSSYVPYCPHCGRANEYGDTMCDPVHPRVCAGSDGDDGEFPLAYAETASRQGPKIIETTDVERHVSSTRCRDERLEEQQQPKTSAYDVQLGSSDTSNSFNIDHGTIDALREQDLAAKRHRLSLEHYQERQARQSQPSSAPTWSPLDPWVMWLSLF
jgi:hypothetical protein